MAPSNNQIDTINLPDIMQNNSASEADERTKSSKSNIKLKWLSRTGSKMPETVGDTSDAGDLEACESDQICKMATPTTKQIAKSINKKNLMVRQINIQRI